MSDPHLSDDRSPDPQLVSRRQALAVGGGLAAAAAAGSMAGATPAYARGGNGGDHPQTMLSISLQQAKAVLAAAEREARRINSPSFIVVVDVCGDVKSVSRQDGNSRASLTLAPLKAQTALAFRTPTTTLAERVADNPVRAQSFLAAGFTLLGGGLPITDEGQVIGAIGVGGGSPEQDVQIGEAGIGALH